MLQNLNTEFLVKVASFFPFRARQDLEIICESFYSACLLTTSFEEIELRFKERPINTQYRNHRLYSKIAKKYRLSTIKIDRYLSRTKPCSKDQLNCLVETYSTFCIEYKKMIIDFSDEGSTLFNSVQFFLDETNNEKLKLNKIEEISIIPLQTYSRVKQLLTILAQCPLLKKFEIRFKTSACLENFESLWQYLGPHIENLKIEFKGNSELLNSHWSKHKFKNLKSLEVGFVNQKEVFLNIMVNFPKLEYIEVAVEKLNYLHFLKQVKKLNIKYWKTDNSLYNVPASLMFQLFSKKKTKIDVIVTPDSLPCFWRYKHHPKLETSITLFDEYSCFFYSALPKWIVNIPCGKVLDLYSYNPFKLLWLLKAFPALEIITFNKINPLTDFEVLEMGLISVMEKFKLKLNITFVVPAIIFPSRETVRVVDNSRIIPYLPSFYISHFDAESDEENDPEHLEL